MHFLFAPDEPLACMPPRHAFAWTSPARESAQAKDAMQGARTIDYRQRSCFSGAAAAIMIVGRWFQHWRPQACILQLATHCGAHDMAQPLMPKATAVWLVENTALTFEQIGDFCGMHPLEVQAIADGEVAAGMQGRDPVAAGEVTLAEIERCSADPEARLRPADRRIPLPEARPKGARYTPVAKRQDRPDGIAWLLKNYPELADAQICKRSEERR